MNSLTVLMVSGDSAVFDPKSTVSERVRSYAKHTGRLDVIIPTATFLSREEKTIHVHSAYHRLKVLRFWRLVTVGERLPRPDIITAQDPFFLGLAAWFIARHHHTPLEIQVHTDVLDPVFRTWSVGNRARVLLARLLLPQAQSVRVVSERIANSLVHSGILSRTQISVLPIPPMEHKPSAESIRSLRARFSPHDCLVLTVSRLAPEKRVDLMLEALALIYHRGFSFQFIIVGDGEERRSLERCAQRLGIFDRVHFVGHVLDPSPYYHVAHVYLSLSVYEGYGLSLVEAARAKLPVISTDVGIAPLVGASLVAPNSALIAELIIRKDLPPTSLPADFIQSEDEYMQAVFHVWSRCAHGAVSPRRKTSYLWLIVKYVISGGTATIVNLGLIFVFTDFFQMWYVLSAALAYAGAFVISFTLQKFWTFQNTSVEKIHSQFAVYVGLGIFNMVLNAGLIYLIVESTGIHYLLAQIGIGIFIACWSFFFYRVLFRKTTS